MVVKSKGTSPKSNYIYNSGLGIILICPDRFFFEIMKTHSGVPAAAEKEIPTREVPPFLLHCHATVAWGLMVGQLRKEARIWCEKTSVDS